MMDGVVRDGDPVSEDEAATLFGGLTASRTLILAVSGGPDSTALMWLAARWRDGLARPPKLITVTIDHGLRKESAREARAVKKLAKALEVEHRTLRWTGKKPKTGIQEAARNARYRLLGDAARKVGARHVLTAHTLDDQAETVLFRMARGSGLSGLRGMAPVSALGDLRLVRPLLTIPKSRLVATLAVAKIPFADDPSNRDPRFTRPRLRELMPRLAAEGLDARRLAVLARRAAQADEAIERAVDDALARLSHDAGKAAVFGPGYADLAAEVRLRALGRTIARVGHEGPVELAKLEALHAALQVALEAARAQKTGAVRFRRTLAGALVTLGRDGLTVEPAPPRRRGTKPGRHKAPFTTPR